MATSKGRRWHVVPGFNGDIEATRTGKIRFPAGIKKGKSGCDAPRLKRTPIFQLKNGRLYCRITRDGISKPFAIANLIAETFIRRLSPDEIARPIDGNAYNLHVNNIGIQPRRKPKVVKRRKVYLTRERVGEIWKLIPDADGTLLVSNISRVIRTGKSKPVLRSPYRIKGRGAATAITYRTKDGKRVTRSMAKLVLQLFAIGNAADSPKPRSKVSGQ